MSEKCHGCGRQLPTTIRVAIPSDASEDQWRYVNVNAGAAGGVPSRMVPMCTGCAPPALVTFPALVAQSVEARS